MIYVTVGTQLPFDRLVRTVDEWAARRGRSDVFAQIGRSDYRPSAIAWTPFLALSESDDLINRAELIVSHAGTGTIIAALMRCKPAIVMPRRAELREHRSNHQVATARRFRHAYGICVAEDEAALYELLDEPPLMNAAPKIAGCAETELIQFVANALSPIAPTKCPGVDSNQ